MLIVRIRSVKIAAKYVQQAMGRRQNAEDEAEEEKKSVLRSENAVEIEFSWFRVGEKRRNCFQSNSFRLSTQRKKCELEISMLCILTYFTTLLQLARKWELAETSSSSFPVAAADLVVHWRVFFSAQDRCDFLRLRSASFSLFKNFHTTLNRPARLRRC